MSDLCCDSMCGEWTVCRLQPSVWSRQSLLMCLLWSASRLQYRLPRLAGTCLVSWIELSQLLLLPMVTDAQSESLCRKRRCPWCRTMRRAHTQPMRDSALHRCKNSSLRSAVVAPSLLCVRKHHHANLREISSGNEWDPKSTHEVEKTFPKQERQKHSGFSVAIDRALPHSSLSWRE